MPEGDTLYRAAVTLRKALLERTVTRFETSVPAVAEAARRHGVEGRTIAVVEARGKHLLITLTSSAPASEPDPSIASAESAPGAGSTCNLQPGSLHPLRGYPPPPVRGSGAACNVSPLVLHTHLRMTGSWHLYRPGERWQKPVRNAKVVIHTDAFVAPCFSAPLVELLTEWQAQRHPDLVALGPDAMTEAFDPEEARRRLRQRPDVEIGVALLNQRVMAGVGNVYKSEVLFTQRLSPFRKVAELTDEELDALIAESHRLLRLNSERGARRTVFGLNDRERLWVYGRSGEPCRACGTPIRMRRQGIDARSTYFCPACQQTEPV